MALEQIWKESRSGARAGKGFRYQDRFIALLLIKQWTGKAPLGFIVPEGLEDVVLECPTKHIWIQIKSKSRGHFSKREITSYYKEIEKKVDRLETKEQFDIAFGLQASAESFAPDSFECLFRSPHSRTIVVPHPEDDGIDFLRETLGIAEILADKIFSDLCQWVGKVSDSNHSVAYRQRHRINITQVEHRIAEFLEAADSSAIDEAIRSGSLRPIDFDSCLDDPNFYSGVRTQPGHVVSELVINRPVQSREIFDALGRSRHVLISGPSGSGKSALAWLTAHTYSQSIRWYRIGPNALASEATSIVRCIRARRPSYRSPIAIVFDQISSANASLWDALSGALIALPEVYLLGTIRNEDVVVLTRRADAQEIRVSLDTELATSIWNVLKQRDQTSWSYWREPFELSNGLLLEYVHILTQGKRLETLLREQVEVREREHRDTELRILRASSLVARMGGEINASRLIEILEIRPENGARAMKRLLDEHLIAESGSGTISGLHDLRSEVLANLTHSPVGIPFGATLTASLPAVTRESLSHVIYFALSKRDIFECSSLIRALASELSGDCSSATWTSILTGLGFATTQDRVSLLVSLLENNNVERTHWHTAAMFVPGDREPPDLGKELVTWDKLCRAIKQYRSSATATEDYRLMCLKQVAPNTKVPQCHTVRELTSFLSAFVGLPNFDLLDLADSFPCIGDSTPITEAAHALEAASAINLDLAASLAKHWGGEHHLFELAEQQIPWITTVSVISRDEHGQTVRGNRYCVSDHGQGNLNDFAVDVCKLLIALSPTSDAAACRVLHPTGTPIIIGDFEEGNKNISREHLHPRPLVAWNVVFRQLVLAQAITHSATEYAARMKRLVERTNKLFMLISEEWIAKPQTPNIAKLNSEYRSILEENGELVYAALPRLPVSMSAPGSDNISDDHLGAIIGGVLGNLVPRLLRISEKADAFGVASFAVQLSEQAMEHADAPLWGVLDSSPAKALSELSERLNFLGNVLCAVGHNFSADFQTRLAKSVGRKLIGSRLRSASAQCSTKAAKYLASRIARIHAELNRHGISSEILTKSDMKPDGIRWPNTEVAILVDLEELLRDDERFQQCVAKLEEDIKPDWPYRIVPTIDGYIVTGAVLQTVQGMQFVDNEFENRWSSDIGDRFARSDVLALLDDAVAAATRISAICLCRDVNNLKEDELTVWNDAVKDFDEAATQIKERWKQTGEENWGAALEYLLDLAEIIKEESDSSIPLSPDTSFYASHVLAHLNGRVSDQIESLARLRLGLTEHAVNQLA